MTGDIDTTLPICTTHLLDRDSSIIHAHGGIATEVTFDRLEEMTVDEFIKNVAPTLGQHKDKLTLIRDSVSGNLLRILNDTVVMYHITGMSDVFIDTLLDKLVLDRPITIRPNLKYPLIQYVQKENGVKEVCVAIPEKQFIFHSAFNNRQFAIWHPPLWLNVQMTSANIPGHVRICAVLDRDPVLENTQTYHIPFPNIYFHGGICFGGTRITTATNRALTESDAIQAIYDQIFTSNFNLDLLRNEESVMRHYYESLPKIKQYEDELKKTTYRDPSYFIHLARCFKEKVDMFHYPYSKLEASRPSVANGTAAAMLGPL